MRPCESIASLLPLSAAGLLNAAEERTMREHVRECAACAARLEALGGIAGVLTALPAPPPPPDLLSRTQALVAAECSAAADRRRGAAFALAGVALSWISWFALWAVYRAASGGLDTVWRPALPDPVAMLTGSILLALLSAPMAAALLRTRRRERSLA
jgi:hypothetical protein